MVGINLPKFQWNCLKHAMQGLDVDFLPWQETLGWFFFHTCFLPETAWKRSGTSDDGDVFSMVSLTTAMQFQSLFEKS